MHDILFYSLLGLSAGAVYAALAQALVVGYRGSGIVNLGQGAMAMYVAYFFYGLRVDGRIMVPPLPNPLSIIEGITGWFGADLNLPNIPTFFHLSAPLSFWPSFALSMLMAAVLGLAIHGLIFRFLRDAPPLAKVIASVGVLLTLQAIVALRFGTDPRSVPKLLPSDTVAIFGVDVPKDRLWLAAIAIAIAASLAMIYRWTRFGSSTEAAATNERGAILAGVNPDRIAAINWVISSVVAGSVGILFASVTGLEITNFTLYVLPALGAALIGGLGSFVIAAAAGLAIGVLQALTIPAQSNWDWFPKVGAADGIPFVVILIAMILRGRKLPERGSLASPRLPAFPEPKNVGRSALIGLPLVAVALVVLPFDLRNGLMTTMSSAVLALSLIVLTGMAGQVSVMQVAIAGMSALAMTRIAADWGVPFPIAPIASALVAAVLGLVASIPALRIRGVHLAVATLGAAVTFYAMVLQNSSLLRVQDANGAIPSPSLFGIDFGINDKFSIGSGGAPNPAFGWFVLALVTLITIGVANLRRNSVGRQFLAIRSNERAAAALGVSVASTKLLAFTAAAFIAGLAGGLDAYRFQGVNADTYVPLASATLLAIVYLGGMTSLSGAFYAGTLAVGGFTSALVERAFHVGEFETLLAGIGLLFMSVAHPEGLAGVAREHNAKLRHRLASLWPHRSKERAGHLVPAGGGSDA